jgi:hypothetical protein
MATLLEQYNNLKTDMTAKIAEGKMPGEQMLAYQEVLYRICVLETCQGFCKSAPVSVDAKALTYHYQLSDGYIRMLLAERKFGQQADKDMKAARETAASSLERIVLDCRRKFSSFTPAKPELYRKSVSTMFNTVLPAWIQYRETYIKIK